MVKVKLLVSRTGGENRGDVVDVSPDEAVRMEAAGQCILVRSKEPEKAVRKAKVEKAKK